MTDPWQSAAAYERFMGRWSSFIAQKFLSWLAIPTSQSWLDVGCGTGSLTKLILETYQPREVTAIDSSADFIAYARGTITSPLVHFKVGLAQSLDVPSDSIDAAVSGLVLNFVLEPKSAVLEMLRVIKPGGTIGVFVWDYAQGMQMLRYFWDAALALDPQVGQLDEGLRFPVCQEGQLEALLRESGGQQLEAAAIEVNTMFQSFDDYWEPFLGQVGPAAAYVAGLGPGDRQKLEQKLRETLPIDQDGSISLTARAWAVKGRA